MALPDLRSASPDAAAPASLSGAITATVPHAALNRLSQLHDESRLALRRAGLMARAIRAAGLLLAMGSVTALFGGGAPGAVFFWSALVLAAIIALALSHLRTAAIFRDMAGSAADLRAIFLCLGAAWGLGAFLALASEPAAIIAFAVLPTLALALLLRDMPALLAFAGPVTFLGAAACALRGDSIMAAGILLLFQAAIGCLLFARRGRAAIIPSGLALR